MLAEPIEKKARALGGRPPLDGKQPGERTTVTLTKLTFDEACAMATVRGVSLSAMIREFIERGVLAERRSRARD